MKTRLLILFVFALGIVVSGCVTLNPSHFPVGLNEQNPVLHDVEDLFENLPTDHTLVKIKGTCNPFKTKGSYNMLNDHVQGVAKIGDRFILAQSTGNNIKKMEKFLLVSGNSRAKCYFNFVGTKFPHCGGIQSCGKILAVAAEPRYGGKSGVGKIVTGMFNQKHSGTGSELLFFDYSAPNKPVLLPVSIKRPDKYAGAGGLAYHPYHRCHYATVYDGGYVDLYKSNGASLMSPACKFSLISTIKAPGASGGGTNLLVDDTGRLYMVGLNRNSEGWETLTLFEIKDLEYTPIIDTLKVKKLSKSKNKGDWQAGFRWGGGVVVKNSNEIEIMAAPRSLCHPKYPTRVKVWTNSKWVRVRHRGWYIAKFYLGWTENGVEKLWRSGKVAAVPKNAAIDRTFERVIELPPNARNISLNVQAMTGRLGKKAWKDVMRREIETRKTYEVYGTVFKPKWKSF